jgi:hypothetical protein
LEVVSDGWRPGTLVVFRDVDENFVVVGAVDGSIQNDWDPVRVGPEVLRNRLPAQAGGVAEQEHPQPPYAAIPTMGVRLMTFGGVSFRV